MTETDTAAPAPARRARKRSGGSRARKKQASQPSAPIRREKSLSLTVVKERQAAAIHKAVLRILWEIGLVVDDQATRALLLAKGCKESEQGRIRYPAELVERRRDSSGLLSARHVGPDLR